jgi:hypothetical protein
VERTGEAQAESNRLDEEFSQVTVRLHERLGRLRARVDQLRRAPRLPDGKKSPAKPKRRTIWYWFGLGGK